MNRDADRFNQLGIVGNLLGVCIDLGISFDKIISTEDLGVFARARAALD